GLTCTGDAATIHVAGADRTGVIRTAFRRQRTKGAIIRSSAAAGSQDHVAPRSAGHVEQQAAARNGTRGEVRRLPGTEVEAPLLQKSRAGGRNWAIPELTSKELHECSWSIARPTGRWFQCEANSGLRTGRARDGEYRHEEGYRPSADDRSGA